MNLFGEVSFGLIAGLLVAGILTAILFGVIRGMGGKTGFKGELEEDFGSSSSTQYSGPLVYTLFGFLGLIVVGIVLKGRRQ